MSTSRDELRAALYALDQAGMLYPGELASALREPLNPRTDGFCTICERPSIQVDSYGTPLCANCYTHFADGHGETPGRFLLG